MGGGGALPLVGGGGGVFPAGGAGFFPAGGGGGGVFPAGLAGDGGALLGVAFPAGGGAVFPLACVAGLPAGALVAAFSAGLAPLAPFPSSLGVSATG